MHLVCHTSRGALFGLRACLVRAGSTVADHHTRAGNVHRRLVQTLRHLGSAPGASSSLRWALPIQGLAAASVRGSSNSSTAAAAAATSGTSSGSMIVERIPVLSDNYVWLLHDSQTGTTAVVDPAEGPPVEKLLNERGWKLDFILNTHHHHDHTGANLELKHKHSATVIGPAADEARIPGIDTTVKEGDSFQLGSTEVRVLDTPGHTKGHITFYMPQAEAMFCGDALFAMGCGRLFEGTPQVAWSSLSKLAALPRATRVYCAHEYTQSNARFAVTVDPSNEALAARKQEVDRLRGLGVATVPSTLGEELDTNPFLRPSDPAIRAKLGFDASAPDHEVFGAIRRAKDGM